MPITRPDVCLPGNTTTGDDEPKYDEPNDRQDLDNRKHKLCLPIPFGTEHVDHDNDEPEDADKCGRVNASSTFPERECDGRGHDFKRQHNKPLQGIAGDTC